MFNVITDAQKLEIEQLAENHHDALVGFGGDMYRRGIIAGTVSAVAGFAVIKTIELGVKAIKRHRQTNKQEES